MCHLLRRRDPFPQVCPARVAPSRACHRWSAHPCVARNVGFRTLDATSRTGEGTLATHARTEATADDHVQARDAPAEERDRRDETGDGTGHVRARRFDADRRDQVLEVDEALASEPSERQLLWIDIAGPMPEGLVTRLTDTFELDDATATALDATVAEPALSVHGSYLHITVAAEPNPSRPRDSPWLTAVAAPNVVITSHEQPITFLEDLDDQVQADSAYGLLDSQSFLATLLHVTVTSYLRSVDRIEEDVERLDELSLRDRRQKQLLRDLVNVRDRIAELRRLLARHRYVYAALDGVVLGDPGGEPTPAVVALADVAKRYAEAMVAIEGARELVLGSFNVFSTRTAQRTNDTMKALTLVTVLLLPGSLVAGLLGMNVVVPLNKEDPSAFWMVFAGVAVLALVILVVARVRRWL
jgi:Mg2+ and Co2+ transporter CorA